MDFSVSAIRAGLLTLPQELYDEIESIVFTAPSGPFDLTGRSNPIIKTSFKFLSISPATRTMYAASYYSREFIFRADLFMSSIGPLITWVNSIPPQHRDFLTKITFVRRSLMNIDSNVFLAGVVRSCRNSITGSVGPQISGKVVYQLADHRFVP